MTIRIVLADDHRMLRDALVLVLGREVDIEVVGVADDGPSALTRVRECMPDMVVLDIAMPGMNGVEVAQILHRDLPNIRILVLSAYVDKRFVLEALKAGATGYVVKTAAAIELARAIRTVASGEHYLSPEITSVVVGQFTVDSETPVAPAGTLTAREREVLRLVAEGVRTTAIARRLGIAEATVEVHRRNVMRKLDLRSVAELTKYALREGLTEL